MGTFSLHAKTYLWLEPFNLKSVSMMLMCISFVSGHEVIVGILNHRMTSGIAEVHFFLVVHKNILLDVLDSLDVTTLVSADRRIEILVGSMGDNFISLFAFLPCGLVVIAFDVEPEVTPSVDHFVVGLFVLFEFL